MRVARSFFLILAIATSAFAGAPIVLVDPLELPDATVGKDYSYDLSKNFKENTGGALTYKIVFDSSSWLKISQKGILTGKPTKPGDFSAAVQVTNSGGSIQNALTVKVAESNEPPVINGSALSFVIKERDVLDLNINDPKYVVSDAPALSFRLVTPTPWATLAANGALKLSPRYAQVGVQDLAFEVSTTTLTSKGVIHVEVAANPQTPVWKNPILKLAATVGQAVSEDISKNVQELDGRALEFTKVSGPRWLGITVDGVLTGSPTDGDLSGNSFVIRASNGTLSADASLTVAVTLGNRPPKWQSARFALKEARAFEKYSANVATYAADPDGDAITFSKVSGPTWVVVSADGAIAGTPRPGDVGTGGAVLIRATDSNKAFSDATAEISVRKANAAPRWTVTEPYPVGEVQEGKNLSVALGGIVVDDEGDTITFSLAQGPAWLSIDPVSGALSGIPPVGSLGSFVGIAQASDGMRSSQLGFAGRVIPTNHPPVLVAGGLSFKVLERRVYTFDLNTVDHVIDPDKGDKLSFSMPAVNWADLSDSGSLTLRPGFEQVGTATLDFEVSDGKDAIAGKISVVVERVPRPPVWKQPEPIQLSATSETTFSYNLKDLVQDRDGLPITFSLAPGGPAWLSIDDKTGRIKGTPTDANAGRNAFVVNAKNDKLGADVALVIDVASDNAPPAWRKPAVLARGKADQVYAQSAKPFAVDPNPDDELSFRKIDGPAWAFVSTGGLVIGAPTEADAKVNSLTIRVTDSRGAFADGTVQVPIDSKNSPPKWQAATIALGNAPIGREFTFDLSAWVNDADGDVLEFRKVEGPAWLLVSGEGQISGIPREAHSGDFTAVFEAYDKKSRVQVDAFGRVQGTSKSPTFHTEALAFTVSPGQVFEVNLNDAKYVEKADGTTLSFSSLSSLPWVALSEEGSLKISATSLQSGPYQFSIRATDSLGLSGDGIVKIDVDSSAKEPIWLSDPIELTAVVDSAFAAELGEQARDLNNLPLTFRKVAGPEWLSVNPATGKISGRPTAQLVAQVQVFTVAASNGKKETSAELRITVVPAVNRVRYALASPVASRAELLFVFDHTTANDAYYQTMKRDAPKFFSTLDKANLTYSVVALSSRSFTGAPLSVGKGVVRVSDVNAPAQFSKLVDASISSDDGFNSPIWSLNYFFWNLRSQTSLYQKDFYVSNVPLFVFVHTSSADKYSDLARGTSSHGVSAETFGNHFAGFHSKQKKPFEIFVNDMSCDADARPTYQALTKSKAMEKVSSAPCGPDFDNGLASFAQEVVKQSVRYQKRVLTLTELPKETKNMEVALRTSHGVHVLKGNSGTADDLWHYEPKERCINSQGRRLDAAGGCVVMHWWNLNVPFVDKNDEIQVTYE